MTKKGLDRMDSPTLCTAKKRNGGKCLNYAIRGAKVCRYHGGSAPQVRAAAQVRILMASDLAAKKLVDLMQSEKVDDRVKLAAAKDLLDRANLAGKQALEVTVEQPRSFEDWVGDAVVELDVVPDETIEAYNALPAGDLDVEDAEVVGEDEDDEEDGEPPIQNRHDRKVFSDSAPPDPRRKTRRQQELEAEEAEALAERDRRESFNKANKRREAFLLALDAGATHEDAAEAGRRAAEGIKPEPFRRERRRARVSTADISRD